MPRVLAKALLVVETTRQGVLERVEMAVEIRPAAAQRPSTEAQTDMLVVIREAAQLRVSVEDLHLRPIRPSWRIIGNCTFCLSVQRPPRLKDREPEEGLRPWAKGHWLRAIYSSDSFRS